MDINRRTLVVAVLSILAAPLLAAFNIVNFLDLKAIDLGFQLRGTIPPSEDIVIVAIDEESFQETGLQWPWPRSYFADVIDAIGEGNPAVIVLDVLWYEASTNARDVALDGDPGNDGEYSDGDRLLAEAIEGAEVVVLANDLQLERRTIVSADGTSRTVTLQGFNEPLPLLKEAAYGLGLANIERDSDGFMRRAPYYLTYQEQTYYSWAAAAARIYAGQDIASQPASDPPNTFLGLKLPIEACRGGLPGACMNINYRGFTQSFRQIPAYQVTNGDIDPSFFENKIVLIGATTEILRDTFPSPFSGAVRPMPGVEVKANMVNTLIDGDFIGDLPGWANTVFALLAALAAFALSRSRRLLLGLIVVLALLVTYVLGWAYAFIGQSLIIPLFSPIIGLVVGFGVPSVERAVTEELERRRIRTAFSHYLSPTLVDQLAKNPDQLQLGGERRNMSFLFSDVRGFTSLSEQITPEQLIRLLNRYLTPMTDLVMENFGTIDKYMGDAIMAFWNAPLHDGDHARHAVETGLRMRARLATLNEELREETEEAGETPVEIRIGIGVNTGDCSVGNMGSQQRFDYSVMGDAVNLASRLEGQSKAYGVDYLVGQDTVTQAPDFAYLELDLLQVKGKSEAVRIFLCMGDAAFKEAPAFVALAETQARLLAAFRAQDWDTATNEVAAAREQIKTFDALGVHLGGLYDLYVARIADYRNNPPGPDWDGVYVALDK